MAVEFTKNTITATITAALPNVSTRVGVELWVEDAPYSTVFEMVYSAQSLVDENNQALFYLQKAIQSILGFDLPDLADAAPTVCPNVCRRWYIKEAQWQYGATPVFGAASAISGGLLAGLGYYGDRVDVSCEPPPPEVGVEFVMVSPTFTATVTKTGSAMQWQDHNGNIIATNTPNFTGIAVGQKIIMLVTDLDTVSKVDVNVATEVSDIINIAHVAPKAIEVVCRGHSIASARIDAIIAEVSANVVNPSTFIFDIYNAAAWDADFTGVMVPRVDVINALYAAVGAEIKVPFIKVSTNKAGSAALNFTSTSNYEILEGTTYTLSALNYATIGTAGSRDVYFYCSESAIQTIEFASENITLFDSSSPLNTSSFSIQNNADLLAIKCNIASIFTGFFTAHQNTLMTACAAGCTFNTALTFIYSCPALTTFAPNASSVFTGQFYAYVNTLMASCAAGCTFNTSLTSIYLCPALTTFAPNTDSVFTGDFLFSSNTSMTACAASATFNTDNTSIAGCSALTTFTPKVASVFTGNFYAGNNTLMTACAAGATFTTTDFLVYNCPALTDFTPNVVSVFATKFHAYANTVMTACGAGATFNTNDFRIDTNPALLTFAPALPSTLTAKVYAYSNTAMTAFAAGATFTTTDLQIFSNPALTVFSPQAASTFTGKYWAQYSAIAFNPFAALINAQFESDDVDIRFDNNGMGSTLVDGILISLANLTLNRYVLWTALGDTIDISGTNAAPTGSGLAAKADLLDVTKSHFETVAHT